MNGLIIFLGESFRIGNQGTRNRGSHESYHGQINACNSHINFIENISNKFNLNSISVFISSYNTQFNRDLLSVYNKFLIGYEFYNDVIGMNNLFHNSINKINNIEKYDFIFYVRIDLFLKEKFIDVFNPTVNMILYPTICWKHDSKVGKDPRVNDTSLFIPKKYYCYIKNIVLGHELWHHLMNTTNLTYNDMDTMINTYHDSDSFKDFNPLYFIVNRNETTVFHSENYIFNKHDFM